jgi:hypothetical protein
LLQQRTANLPSFAVRGGEQRHAAVGERGMLGARGRLAGLDRQAEDAIRYLSPQPVLPRADVCRRGGLVPFRAAGPDLPRR